MKINMKNGNKKAELLLYEDIGGWFGTTAASFVKQVKDLGDVNEIDLRINSNGGDVFDGVTIGNYLRQHKATVNVYIDGLAASIASIIAMAGNNVYIAQNAWMMIHDPWGCQCGSAQEMRDYADLLDGIRDTLLDTYMVRASYKREKISEMMAVESWMNANEVIDAGLADSIVDSLDMAASIHKGWFKNVPSNLQDKIEPAPIPTPISQLKHQKVDNVKKSKQNARMDEIRARMARSIHRLT